MRVILGDDWKFFANRSWLRYWIIEFRSAIRRALAVAFGLGCSRAVITSDRCGLDVSSRLGVGTRPLLRTAIVFSFALP